MSIAVIGQISLNLGICAFLLTHFVARSASHTERIANAATAERLYQTCIREGVLNTNLEQSKVWIERHTRQQFADSATVRAGLNDSSCDGINVGYRILATEQNATFPDWPNWSVTYAVK